MSEQNVGFVFTYAAPGTNRVLCDLARRTVTRRRISKRRGGDISRSERFRLEAVTVREIPAEIAVMRYRALKQRVDYEEQIPYEKMSQLRSRNFRNFLCSLRERFLRLAACR